MSETTTDIDDRHSSISYSGSWKEGGSLNEYRATTTFSLNAGDSFTVPFIGTSITVIGTTDSSSGGVQTSYSIDGGQSTSVTHNTSSTGRDIFGQEFWKSGKLDQGTHSLKVTMEKVNPSPDGIEGTVWFDEFRVVGTPSSTVTPPRKKPIGAIVGGVVGGVFFLLALMAFFFLYLRRKRTETRSLTRSEKDELAFDGSESPRQGFSVVSANHSSANSSTLAVEPFQLPTTTPFIADANAAPRIPRKQPLSSLQTRTTLSASSQPPTSSTSSSSGDVPSSSNYSDSRQLVRSGGSLKRHRPENTQANEARSEPSLIQHVDSGRRNVQDDSQEAKPIELPPIYSP